VQVCKVDETKKEKSKVKTSLVDRVVLYKDVLKQKKAQQKQKK